MGAGRRLEGHAIDADHSAKDLLQPPHQLEGALDGLFVLVRVEGSESGQRRCRFVGDRVVLHGAAAEGIELLADGVVHRRELAVVTHDLGLAQPRQCRRQRPQELAGEDITDLSGDYVRVGQPGPIRVGPALFEAERLGHQLTASTSSSIARGSLTSVHVNVNTPLSSRNQRCTSSPPRIPLRASFRFSAAGLGTRIGNSFKNCRSGKASSQPGNAASLAASAWARLKLTSATWPMPSPPMYATQ